MKKSTIEEIKDRFDNDVERFSNIDTAKFLQFLENFIEEMP